MREVHDGGGGRRRAAHVPDDRPDRKGVLREERA